MCPSPYRDKTVEINQGFCSCFIAICHTRFSFPVDQQTLPFLPDAAAESAELGSILLTQTSVITVDDLYLFL